MTDSSTQNLDTIISIDANNKDFYSLIVNLQSLYNYLQHNSSSRCENNYIELMAHLLENYLDSRKKLFLRNHLGDMIADQTDNEYAAQYFKKRFSEAALLDLLKYHHNLTGKWLILTSVDYEKQKFKLKIN